MSDYPQGINFPFRIQPAGGVGIVSAADKVASNLKALVLTHVHERLIYKDLGTVGYMAILRNASMRGLIKRLVEEAIIAHEKRAARVQVEVIPKEIRGVQHIFAQVSYVFTLSGEMVYSEIDLS